MRIFEEIKKNVDEIKIEDKKLFDKRQDTYLDKLFLMVRDEFVDFSLMIKESKNKLENLFMKNNPIKIKNNNNFITTTPPNRFNNKCVNKTKNIVDECDNIGIVYYDLRRKFDELLTENLELKENNLETNIKNIGLKNKIQIKTEEKNKISLIKSKPDNNFNKNDLKNTISYNQNIKEDFYIPPENSRALTDSILKVSDTKIIIKSYLDKVCLNLT